MRFSFVIFFVLVLPSIVTAQDVHHDFFAAIQKQAETQRKWRIGSDSFPKDRAGWLAASEEIRGELRQLFDFPEKRVSLDPEIVGVIDRGTFEITKLILTAEPGNRITALLYLPKGDGPFPAVVCASGHGGSKSTPYNQYFGQMLAAAGCAVLVPDPIGEEERDEQLRFGPRGHRQNHRVDHSLGLGLTTVGKMIFDITRCIDYLETLPEIDTARIGCAGHSLGGTVTEYATAVDSRIRLSLVAGWTSNLAAITTELSCCWRVPGLLQVVGDPEIFALGAAHCSTLILGGENDVTPLPVDDFREKTLLPALSVYELFGRKSHLAFHVTPDTGHEPFHLNRQALAWLDLHFDLPRITRQEIAQLGPATVSKLPQQFKDAQWQLKKIYNARAPYADVKLLPFSDLHCLKPGQEEQAEFGMAGWMASKKKTFAPQAKATPESIRKVLHLPGTVPALSVAKTGAPVNEAEKFILYLHQSRTARGGSESSRFDKEKLTVENTCLITLDAVPFNETLNLLGSSSTAYTVKHVLNVVAGLNQSKPIHVVSEVDEVGELTAVLEPRITSLTIAGNPRTTPSRQTYRWSGVVPGLRKVVSRKELIAMLAPRKIVIEKSAGL